MSNHDGFEVGAPRRPLLGGGERLREEVERPGGGRPPQAPYGFAHARELLQPQVEELRRGVSAMPRALRSEHVLFEATLLPNYLAGSHFPEALLRATDLYPVGARQATATYQTKKRRREDEPTKTLLLAGPPESVDALAALIASEVAHGEIKIWEQIREFGRIGLPDPRVVVRGVPTDHGAGEIFTWEAVLNPIGRTPAERQQWGDEAFIKFVAHIEALGGEVDFDYRRVVREVTFVPIALPVELVYSAPAFNLLRALRPMPKVRPVPTTTLRSSGNNPVPRPPASDSLPSSTTRVAIFDGGINPASPYIHPFATLHNLTSEAPSPALEQHGSLVTSAFLWGSAQLGQPLPRPPGYVDHYRVLPPPARDTFDDSLYWVLDQIVASVTQNGHKLVNLSLGPDRAVEDDGEPDRWTAELDALAEGMGVTFVVAAGNNGQDDDALGFNRVQIPADMVNGLAVGACMTRDTTRRLERAPYSALGWGRPGQRICPTGVAFGGVVGREPFLAFDQHGRLLEVEGTSFAAPLVARALCELSTGLGDGRATPATLRGFAAHFAERGRGHRPRVRQLGYGRLRESYGGIWDCAPNEVAVLYRHILERGEATAMRFPFPDGLEADIPISLLWTLSYASGVNPADASDYTCAGLEITFRPHDNMRSIFDAETKESIVTVDIVRDEALVRTLAATRPVGWNDTPVAHSDWRRLRSERAQRLSGKWETLSQGELTLPAAELLRPRLDLLYLARKDGALLREDVPALPISLLLTLRAPEGVPLYDLVQHQFPVLTPITQQLESRINSAA